MSAGFRITLVGLNITWETSLVLLFDGLGCIGLFLLWTGKSGRRCDWDIWCRNVFLLFLNFLWRFLDRVVRWMRLILTFSQLLINVLLFILLLHLSLGLSIYELFLHIRNFLIKLRCSLADFMLRRDFVWFHLWLITINIWNDWKLGIACRNLRCSNRWDGFLVDFITGLLGLVTRIRLLIRGDILNWLILYRLSLIWLICLRRLSWFVSIWLYRSFKRSECQIIYLLNVIFHLGFGFRLDGCWRRGVVFLLDLMWWLLGFI